MDRLDTAETDHLDPFATAMFGQMLRDDLEVPEPETGEVPRARPALVPAMQMHLMGTDTALFEVGHGGHGGTGVLAGQPGSAYLVRTLASGLSTDVVGAARARYGGAPRPGASMLPRRPAVRRCRGSRSSGAWPSGG
jgi:hypothetical protein